MRKRGGKPDADWLIENRNESLDQRLEHNIYVWGHKEDRRTFGATKDTAARRFTFWFAYWLLCLDGHAFVLAAIFLE